MSWTIKGQENKIQLGGAEKDKWPWQTRMKWETVKLTLWPSTHKNKIKKSLFIDHQTVTRANNGLQSKKHIFTSAFAVVGEAFDEEGAGVDGVDVTTDAKLAGPAIMAANRADETTKVSMLIAASQAITASTFMKQEKKTIRGQQTEQQAISSPPTTRRASSSYGT